jgi:hypothetical protein
MTFILFSMNFRKLHEFLNILKEIEKLKTVHSIGPALAQGLRGTAWPSWGFGPWHGAGARAPSVLAARSPLLVR